MAFAWSGAATGYLKMSSQALNQNHIS